MKITFTDNGWADYLHWQAEDTEVLRKINELIRDIKRTSFQGLGKPEPLKGALKGWWSRRITQEHRLVYRVNGTGAAQILEIVQCRYHY